MSFLAYDLVFLFVFLVFSSIFLYTRRHNLKREGLLFLYKTSWGIKLINSIGKKYKKTLNALGYVSITFGYILMAGVIYLVFTIVKVYIFNPNIVRAIKVPPILPLFPYLPQAFNLDFLPPFYFTYWIVILAIIAITHEMAHGFFAARDNVKIKTTGFGFFPFFLPIFLAAFVELDEKKMVKKSKFSQMSILSAGTFANVLTGILFFGILVLFFSSAFSPAGVIFDSYATSAISIAGVSYINGIAINNSSYDKIIELADRDGLNEMKIGNKSYLVTKEVLENQKNNKGVILVYNSAPAIKSNLSSIIIEINGVKTDNMEKLVSEIAKYSPGDQVIIKTKTTEGIKEQFIMLEEHPERAGTAWLGIGFTGQQQSSVVGKVVSKLSSFKQPNIYYEPNYEVSVFIYNLLWWIILISLSVALMNMLPVGIFDGGRFFYLTVLGITKNENIAKRAFAFSTYFFLFVLLLLMVFWALRIF